MDTEDIWDDLVMVPLFDCLVSTIDSKHSVVILFVSLRVQRTHRWQHDCFGRLIIPQLEEEDALSIK